MIGQVASSPDQRSDGRLRVIVLGPVLMSGRSGQLVEAPGALG
jgi:hypothetical protein